jgi:hypothetical protein
MPETITENRQVILTDQRLQLLSEELHEATQEFLEKMAELEKLLALVDE